MKIRKAKLNEIRKIKKLVDETKEMDVVKETFSEDYFKRILKQGILLVAEDENEIVGVVFGKYHVKEEWADLLGLVVEKKFRKKGIGTELVKEFEKIIRAKEIKTIDLYSDKLQVGLFNKLKYNKGRIYVSFRKVLK